MTSSIGKFMYEFISRVVAGVKRVHSWCVVKFRVKAAISACTEVAERRGVEIVDDRLETDTTFSPEDLEGVQVMALEGVYQWPYIIRLPIGIEES